MVKAALKKNGFARVMSKGFSLLEVVVVIALMAMIATIVVPRLTRRRVALKQQFTEQLNGLTRTAQLSAMMTGTLHRIFFDIKNGRIIIQQEAAQRDSQGHKQFVPLKIPYVTTSLPISKELDIDQFLVKGKKMMQSGEGIQFTGAWFYIVPEGMTQEVTLEVKERDTSKKFSLTVNPFTALFSAS